MLLAGISIAALTNQGLFARAQEAKDVTEQKTAEENTILGNYLAEIDKITGGTSGGQTQPQLPPTDGGNTPLATKLTALNYGDYVNYPVDLDEDGDTTNDWKIFYKDDAGRVFIIASWYLPYSKMPEVAFWTGESEYPYAAIYNSDYSDDIGVDFFEISEEVANKYQYSFKWNGNYRNGMKNVRNISEILYTSKWKKFVLNKTNGFNKDLAVDAIGTPTLEMWINSWKEKGNATQEESYIDINISIDSKYGYTIVDKNNDYVDVIGTPAWNDSLYFPSISYSSEKGSGYWLASPHPGGDVVCVYYNGIIGDPTAYYYDFSFRPLVCLNPNVDGEKDENGIWNLK